MLPAMGSDVEQNSNSSSAEPSLRRAGGKPSIRGDGLSQNDDMLEQHLQAIGPKRILALDGGGVRGILTLGILEEIEALLRRRHGDKQLTLCDYFDLMAGTSTGSIIAALLAQGKPVEEVKGLYLQLAAKVFRRPPWRQGIMRPRYGERRLSEYLREHLSECRIGDNALRTGLLIVSKRIDTNSPWPIGNNPAGRYYNTDPKSNYIANRNYPLWKVVRASTAAPTFFLSLIHI